MPYNSETETFYQAPATVVDSTPDGDTVQEGFDDRLTPALTALYDDLNILKADGMISVGIPATTTARGIGRVATSADWVDGATINNGPAFFAAGSSDAVAWAKYAAHDVGDLTASLATSKAFYLLCNGGAYSRTTYAALFALLGTSFGAGDGSTTFNVPDFRGRTIQGANANLMSVLAAGLPNITSTANSLFLAGEISPTVSGAFTKSRRNTGLSNSTGTSTNSNIEYIGFDASQGGTDPIYGKSTTVQSPAIATNIFIKF